MTDYAARRVRHGKTEHSSTPRSGLWEERMALKAKGFQLRKFNKEK